VIVLPFVLAASWLLYLLPIHFFGFLALQLLQNGIWLILFFRREKLRWLWAAAILTFIFARTTPPLYENDFYRYFWDGLQTLHTGDPFTHPPAAVPGGAWEHVRSLVSFPEYATIYPPLAQILFACLVALSGKSLSCFLWLLSGFGGSLFARAFTRLSTGVSVWLVLLHPLLVREWFQACHFDVFVAAALITGIALTSPLALGLAASLKITALPALLTLPRRKRALAVFLGITVLPLLPFLPELGVFFNNLTVFSGEWEMNSGFFRLIPSRVTCLGIWAAIALPLLLNRRLGPGEKVFWTLHLLVLLSPVANPWYFTWSLPFVFCLPPTQRNCILWTYPALPLAYAFFTAGLPYEWYWGVEHTVLWAGVLAAMGIRFREARWRVREGTTTATALPVESR